MRRGLKSLCCALESLKSHQNVVQILWNDDSVVGKVVDPSESAIDGLLQSWKKVANANRDGFSRESFGSDRVVGGEKSWCKKFSRSGFGCCFCSAVLRFTGSLVQTDNSKNGLDH